MTRSNEPVLEVSNLQVTFDVQPEPVVAVDDVSFSLRRGQTLGIVGESGSGKSVTSRSIMRLLRPPGRITGGSIRLRGKEINSIGEHEMESLRGTVAAMVFQDPQSALNPVLKIREQIAEALRIHGVERRSANKRAIELLTQVGIPDPPRAAEKYPHEFSGGMRQRVVIAIALANNPELLIADEPTTALDVTVQAQILQLIGRLRDELGISILFISHDLGVVADLCDDVIVMRKGKIVEQGPVRQVLATPSHPYTRQLLAAVPTLSSPLRPDDPPESSNLALDVQDVRVELGSRRGLLSRPSPFVAVDGVSLKISPGETLALVGESGCGKSTLSRAIMGIREYSGKVCINGIDSKEMDAQTRARTIQYVFQDPFSSLNPRRTAGQSLSEALRVAGVPRRELRERSVELLEKVHLGPEHVDRYPWAFSGGQRQRIGIARALATEPQVLILDEPVSALDVSIQAQILELLSELQQGTNLSFLFISHDLAVVREISHRVAVMRRGKIVEEGPAAQIFERPTAEYTKELLAATPDLGRAIAS